MTLDPRRRYLERANSAIARAEPGKAGSLAGGMAPEERLEGAVKALEHRALGGHRTAGVLGQCPADLGKRLELVDPGDGYAGLAVGVDPLLQSRVPQRPHLVEKRLQRGVRAARQFSAEHEGAGERHILLLYKELGGLWRAKQSFASTWVYKSQKLLHASQRWQMRPPVALRYATASGSQSRSFVEP